MPSHGKDFELNLDCELHQERVVPDWVEHTLTGDLPEKVLVKINDFIAAECYDDLLEYLAADAAECAAG